MQCLLILGWNNAYDVYYIVVFENNDVLNNNSELYRGVDALIHTVMVKNTIQTIHACYHVQITADTRSYNNIVITTSKRC